MGPGVKFLGIPGIFLHHYKSEIGRWLQNFRKIGPHFEIWLKIDVLGPMVIGDGSSLPMVPSIERVRLTGTYIEQGQIMIVRPFDGKTEKRIGKHSEALEDLYGQSKQEFLL